MRKLYSPLFLGVCAFSLFFNVKGHSTTSLFTRDVSDSVLFICKETFELRRKWKYGENVLFNNAAIMDERFKSNVILLANYSLFINPIFIQNEGSYECVNGSLPVTRHQLIVKGCIKLHLYSLCENENMIFFLIIRTKSTLLW